MVLVSFSSKELVRKLDERRAAEDSYCSFEALELGFAALQSGRDGAEVGRQYGAHGGAQKRLWAEDHRLHGEHLQQGASERFCARVSNEFYRPSTQMSAITRLTSTTRAKWHHGRVCRQSSHEAQLWMTSCVLIS